MFHAWVARVFTQRRCLSNMVGYVFFAAACFFCCWLFRKSAFQFGAELLANLSDESSAYRRRRVGVGRVGSGSSTGGRRRGYPVTIPALAWKGDPPIIGFT